MNYVSIEFMIISFAMIHGFRVGHEKEQRVDMVFNYMYY